MELLHFFQPTTNVVEIEGSSSFPVEVAFSKGISKKWKTSRKMEGRSKTFTDTPDKDVVEQQKAEKKGCKEDFR